ncbi:AEC family transporter [Blautia schinkii]|nr:AEC family transporter [Blautia schinkii]
MQNLIFCLNATIPIFLTLILGFFFRRINLFDDAFVSRMNKFVFSAALPALLFQDISNADFYEVWDGKMVIFCFLATCASIAIATGLSFFLKPKDIQGEFIQSSYRSSAALLGIAVMQNLYGNAGMAPLMIIASVPLYNVMAVIVLSLFRPGREKLNRRLIKNTIRGIVTNPIILGILVGMVWSVFRLPKPTILDTTVNNLGKIATPLGLMAMGGSLKLGKAFARLKAAIACTLLKLVGFEALFLPVAIALGFTRDKLVAIIIMLGSATTVSCFIMAKNMDHEGSFSSGVILLTTLFSAFTLTGWLFLCRSLGLI